MAKLDAGATGQIDRLQEKFDAMGQGLEHQLEGVVHAKPINYWDYIQTDVLLNLQVQRTLLPDEMVFILYHQVNELLFKMVLWEMEQIASLAEEAAGASPAEVFIDKLGRISRYFDMLTASFTIMREGMDMEQYLKFRRTLSPASGFQSAQYRQIEFASTDVINLVDDRYREKFRDVLAQAKAPSPEAYEALFEHLYWQAAGSDFKGGKKTYTLEQFELKYKAAFLRSMTTLRNKNLYAIFRALPIKVQKNKYLIKAMRHYDHTVNITWVMAHYRAALHYLNQGKEPLDATGGSHWIKYMHPKYQRRIFFPSLWSEKELATWGQEQGVKIL